MKQERLTEKTNDLCSYNIDKDFSTERSNGYDINFSVCALEDIAKKLGQLEDIEEELGIDLITLFKALKKGIYIKYSRILGKEETIVKTRIDEFRFIGGYFRIWIKDYATDLMVNTYGKRWAFTREELL